MCRYNLPKIFEHDPQLSKLRYVLWDTYGLTSETYNNNEFNLFVEGRLPHEYEMNSVTQLPNNQNFTCVDEPQRKIHSILFVVAQGDRGDRELMNRLREMFLEALKASLQPLVVISKIDEVAANEDLETLKNNIAQQIGAPRHSIFTTENYHGNDPKRRFDIDKNTYMILEAAIRQGELYLKSSRNRESY